MKKGDKVCFRCNKNWSSPDNYCRDCGGHLNQIYEDEEVPEVKIQDGCCSVCKTKKRDSDKFCGGCGAKF